MVAEPVVIDVFETVSVRDCLLDAELVGVTVTVRDGFSDLEAVLVIVEVIVLGCCRVGDAEAVLVLETLIERVAVTEPVDVLLDRIERVTDTVLTIESVGGGELVVVFDSVAVLELVVLADDVLVVDTLFVLVVVALVVFGEETEEVPVAVALIVLDRGAVADIVFVPLDVLEGGAERVTLGDEDAVLEA